MENIIKLLNAVSNVESRRVKFYTDTRPILYTHDPKKVLKIVTKNQSRPFETVLDCDEIAQNEFFDDSLFELALQSTNRSITVLEIDPYTTYYLYPVGTKIKVNHNGRIIDCCMLTTLKTYEYSCTDDVLCVSLSELTK
ncbi:hypothetical protein YASMINEVIRUS_935 [Yasminevirus sp. GU-2018]|uniref:Uncharacterized protein n=1 Tax=Yasminevirus sp. GU-2018 TaxID=2420051 RepID=A0A5K0UAF0_9VIRU|nr:hypothetical protein YASMINEVIRUS_935 [Yasminevirus sp. GU-2018]